MTSDPVSGYRSTQAGRIREAEALRPMRPNEVLDAASRVYQRAGLSFLRMTALPCVFCVAALAFVGEYTLPNLATTSHPQSTGAQAAEFAATVLVALVLGLPLFVTGLSFGGSAVMAMTAAIFEGREPDEAGAVREAKRVLPRTMILWGRNILVGLSGVLAGLALAGIGAVLSQSSSSEDLAGVATGFGVLVVIAGAVWLVVTLVRSSLSPVVLLTEGAKPKQANRRSNALLRSVPMHGSGYGVILNLFVLLSLVLLGMTAAGAVLLEWLSVESRIESALSGSLLLPFALACVKLAVPYLTVWALLPFWACSLTVCYFERRIRLEGFDIERLAASIKDDE